MIKRPINKFAFAKGFLNLHGFLLKPDLGYHRIYRMLLASNVTSTRQLLLWSRRSSHCQLLLLLFLLDVKTVEIHLFGHPDR